MSQGPSMRDCMRIVESYNQKVTEDPGDWDHGYNYEANENDFEPATNMCPDCEGTGESRMSQDSAFPGLTGDCERCNGAGEIFEELEDETESSSEKLLYPPTVYDGEGNEHPYEIYHDAMASNNVGDIVTSHAAAPGYGKISHRITRMDDTGVYGVVVDDTIRELEPWMVEEQTPSDYPDYPEDCPKCGESLGGVKNGTYCPKGCKLTEDPYATMKDGPDKYLFRKDQKQKLVGSADNEPEDGEEELEETDMDKFIREMQVAAGIKVAEDYDDRMLHGTNKCEFCGKENCDQDCDEALGIGEFADEDMNEDCDQDVEKNDDGECSPFTHADENVDMVREDNDKWLGPYEEDDRWLGKTVKITSGDYQGETGKVIDIDLYRSEQGVRQAEYTIKLHSGATATLYPSEWSRDQLELEEDLLLAPQDEPGPEVDEDDMIYGEPGFGEPGEGSSHDATDLGPDAVAYDNLGDVSGEDQLSARSDRNTPDYEPRGDDYPIDEGANDNWGVGDYVVTIWEEPGKYSEPLRVTGVYGDQVMVTDDYGNSELMSPDDLRPAPSNEGLDEGPDSDDPSAMECPGCKDLAFVKTGKLDDGDDEFECENCGHYGTFAGLEEQGPGEFDYDPDAMIDVGDEEDYEEYDFNDEFETMLGGSSDMPEAELVGMYEMNDLRRLAGLEQIMEEEECDKCETCDCDPCECEKEELGEIAMACGDVEEARAASAPITDDSIAYEVDSESAYFVMADMLGAELDFGPEDEILVPVARNDQMLAALEQQGFVKGTDFWVAGEQYEADLQNGYNDRQFSDGQDYFPKGSHQSPSSDLGPSASGLADNPMANKMRSVEKDDVYETMKLAYRRHRKS